MKMSKKERQKKRMNELFDVLGFTMYILLFVGNLFLFGFLFVISLEVDGGLILFYMVVTALSTFLFAIKSIHSTFLFAIKSMEIDRGKKIWRRKKK